MPAVAAGVKRDNAAFYWHLGDYRAIYMRLGVDYLKLHPKTNIIDFDELVEILLELVESLRPRRMTR